MHAWYGKDTTQSNSIDQRSSTGTEMHACLSIRITSFLSLVSLRAIFKGKKNYSLPRFDLKGYPCVNRFSTS